MKAYQQLLAREVTTALERARNNRGDWMAELERVAEDLAEGGFANESQDLSRALDDARGGSHDDWLALIESVADKLA